MKLALAAAVIALTGAAPQATVLGWDYGSKRISWFESDSLTSAKGGATGWNRPLCSWSFSPDRHSLALSDCHGTVRFVAVPSLKSLGRIGASSGVWDAASLAWVAPTRLLAVNRASGSVATLLVVDTTTKRVVRRVDLGGVLLARALVRDRVVLLLAPFDSFGPARVAVADSSGALTSARIEGITAGSHFSSEPDADPIGEVRTPGFAVDPSGTAYVVGPDLRVAAVDLATMRVSYHGPTRAPAKALNGTTRIAAWLGRGKIAVSGIDFASTGTGNALKVSTTPFGLQLLDTATWTYRTLDADAAGLVADGTRVLATAPARSSAYDAAGAHLYDIPAPNGTWVTPALGHAYVCSERWLTGVLDLSTGASLAAPKPHTRGCPTLLTGRAADF
jgi:WD40 repeat protein